MLSSLLFVISLLSASVVAQSSSTVVCIAGQCLQGLTNITIGATISAPGAPTSIHLLPGQYTSLTNPQLLHNLLTAPSASLTSSPGFESSSSSISLPLNLALEPGLAIYSDIRFSGPAAFSQLPSSSIANSSVPLAAKSFAISTNVWASIRSSSEERIVFWDTVPDVTQLPADALGSLALLDLQSSACSPPCAGTGVCSASGTCACPSGFTGSACESCAPGFFGPTCQACPTGCTSCDEGVSGTGRCLTPLLPSNAPSTCNCLNGICGSDGQCACNDGWTNADNGTACAKCSAGFFLTSTSDCKVCQAGCTQCADGTGACLTCKTGFTKDANDPTKCNPVQTPIPSGDVCPLRSFNDGTNCALCSPSCQSCTGPSSNDCAICVSGQYLLNGACVSANSDGVCQGSKMIADNNKFECDTCGAKCTTCKIPNFSIASTASQRQCTGCLPGFVLSDGECVASCPTGFFVSPQDNLTCTRCDASCICLSELVAVPQPSGTSTPAPLPSITGLTNPTVIENETRRPLEWWQILLMALGCAFIFVLVLMLWRRHARKQRAKRTAMFAQSKKLDDRNSWKWRLVRFGERLFGHRPSRRVIPESEDIKLLKLRQAEEARRDHDLEKLIDSYGDPTPGGPSGGSSSDPHASSGRRRSHLAANSLYSEATGIPRRSPDVRQPVKDYRASARMSTSTYSSYMYRSNGPRVEKDSDIPPVPTEAQVYATAMKPVLATSPPATQGSYWIQPVATGSSNNPFRK
ncbi:hypothetical protein PC9H_001566 [Pleurotus ostreatus]|uniref:EGF-like domain-containing protein n=1 Tax=Pleurotus ostreatus TaxID=5322 RepID=A0A8H7DXL9_PLEOS|nr:uncharacterized protein PC9H_001566 [Pleurotus ostreatus]KAF7441217.1 hypothetical protein PC9H_001566 [Pleurotus ostreatus]